jgi:hypothetical protein
VAKVVGMSLPPLSLAIARDLAILRIRTQLVPVIIGAALALALRFTADHLLGTKNRRPKRTLTEGTATRLAQASSSGDCENESLRRIETTRARNI